MTANEPKHVYRELRPLQSRYLADPNAPTQECHENHVDDVLHASKGKGFPVAPCVRQWP